MAFSTVDLPLPLGPQRMFTPGSNVNIRDASFQLSRANWPDTRTRWTSGRFTTRCARVAGPLGVRASFVSRSRRACFITRDGTSTTAEAAGA